MRAMRVWFFPLVVVAVASLSACFEPLALGSTCTRDTECDDDTLACVRVDGGRVCLPKRDGEGEGEEGEGEVGEGEGEGEGEVGEGEGEGEVGEGEGEGEGCLESDRRIPANSGVGAHVAARAGEVAVVFGAGPKVVFAPTGNNAAPTAPVTVGNDPAGEFTTAVDVAFNAATNDWMVIYIHTSDRRELKLVTIDADTRAATTPVVLRALAENIPFESNHLLVRSDGSSVVLSSASNIDSGIGSIAAVQLSASMMFSSVSVASGAVVAGQPMLESSGAVLFAVSPTDRTRLRVLRFATTGTTSTVLDTTKAGNVAATVFVGTSKVVAYAVEDVALDKSYFACPVDNCTAATTFSSEVSMLDWGTAGVASLGGDRWFIAGEGETSFGPGTPVPIMLTAEITTTEVAPSSPGETPAGLLGSASAAAFSGGVAALYGVAVDDCAVDCNRDLILATRCSP
jgi:hypothetical protein